MTFQVKTRARSDAVDITGSVRDAVKASGIQKGLCVVYVPHTTAGITINEGADPNVMRDLLDTLERLVPWQGAYKHTEGNAAAHIKASMVGSSVHIIIDRGELVLGTWQRVFLCEFDGPRTRKVLVKILEEK